MQYRLVIADDHPLFRGALREAVAGLLERVDIAEAGTFDELVELLERGGDVDLVLLDLAMPGVRGFSGLMYMRAQYPGVPAIVVSANDDPATIRRCMGFGASGFIPKTLCEDGDPLDVLVLMQVGLHLLNTWCGSQCCTGTATFICQPGVLC